jgi:hypothetical protein
LDCKQNSTETEGVECDIQPVKELAEVECVLPGRFANENAEDVSSIVIVFVSFFTALNSYID